MKNTKTFYAITNGDPADDLCFGSYDLHEALDMMDRVPGDNYIAIVYDGSEPFVIGEIRSR